MILRKEVLQRLLLAKSILAPARAMPRGQPSEHVVARQVLNAHDASDLVFAGIADQQGKLPSKGPSPPMLQCLDLIESEAEKHSGYFKQLNDARNGLKHAGNLPNTNQWASVAEDVYDKLSSMCKATLEISLDEVDESELLVDDVAKDYLQGAKRARNLGNFKLALEEIARALWASFINMPGLTIDVGRPKAEDALKLTAFGISADDFLRLPELMPVFVDYPAAESNRVNASDIVWEQNRFGHPGNWREEVVDFCIDTYLDVALSIQNAPDVPYPVRFGDLYDYTVTAAEDSVEVRDDLIELGGFDERQPNVRPFRGFKRYLAKGESITLSGSTQPLVSEDRALDGQHIKRVHITNIGFQGIFPHGKPEFVNRAQVRITCVPSEIAKAFRLTPICREFPMRRTRRLEEIRTAPPFAIRNSSSQLRHLRR